MRLIDADKMRENLLWCKEQSGSYNDVYWDDVIERLDVQPTVGGWISVSDKLPEEGQEVVIRIGDDKELVRFWDYRWVGKEEWFILDLPTHWMPIPEPIN